ncbi:MAG: 4-hydroxy-3-methylbut-2-enyl diphosphate reductase [Candidatus Omnitrophota bacterium]|nr:4-hydroxy-3-methylbut-2-enyl diphosphate reductase [Candidatus Omnitrophota bacterium]
MKISLAKSAGFCFGVKRAIEIALKAAKSERKVYTLGDIVHNEKVCERIAQAGIKKTKRLLCGKNRVLLIRAHGIPLNLVKKARLLGYTIIDATCPMVKEIHKIVRKMENKGYKIIIIGDHKHEEVQGIKGQLKSKAVVIDSVKNMPFKKIKKIKKACAVAQSTQNLRQALEVVDELKKYIPELKFFDTICSATKVRQEEITRMPLENDLMIIIGSKGSANTKRLYQISKSLNKKSYWINSRAEIKNLWFRNVKKVGISAGASTPQETIQEIVSYISGINP